jgi:hypothetical protein
MLLSSHSILGFSLFRAERNTRYHGAAVGKTVRFLNFHHRPTYAIINWSERTRFVPDPPPTLL